MRTKLPILLGVLFTVINATALVVLLHGTAAGQLQSQYGNASVWLRLVNEGGDGGIIEATADSQGRLIVTGSQVPNPLGVEVLNTQAAPIPVTGLSDTTPPSRYDVLGFDAGPVGDGGFGGVVELAPGAGTWFSSFVAVPHAPDGGITFCWWNGDPTLDGGGASPLMIFNLTQAGPPGLVAPPGVRGAPFDAGLFMSYGVPNCLAPSYLVGNSFANAVTVP